MVASHKMYVGIKPRYGSYIYLSMMYAAQALAPWRRCMAVPNMARYLQNLPEPRPEG